MCNGFVLVIQASVTHNVSQLKHVWHMNEMGYGSWINDTFLKYFP